MKELKFGVIGISPGNGHPYSWSAIFNGYDEEEMSSCPYPVIYDYLSKQTFPQAAITGARVTRIWTQDPEISRKIARASKIENVVQDLKEMIGKVDGVLLARDDAENHLELAKPFLEAGIPIYIDKPLAYTIENAKKLFDLEKFEGQLFTCSALRYAEELLLTKDQKEELGIIKKIVCSTPKDWRQYSIHLIEPLLANFNFENTEKIFDVKKIIKDKSVLVNFKWENDVDVTLHATGESTGTINLHFFGSKSDLVLTFKDSFTAFRSSLNVFTESVKSKTRPISVEHTLQVIKLVELGVK